MPQDTWQNNKTEKSDNTKLPHAKEEAGPREPHYVWTCVIPTCSATHTGPNRPHPGTPSTSYGDLQGTLRLHSQGKQGLPNTLRMQHKPQKLCCIVFKILIPKHTSGRRAGKISIKRHGNGSEAESGAEGTEIH